MSGKEGRKSKAKIVLLPLCFHGSIDRNESVRSGSELLDKKEVYLFPLEKYRMWVSLVYPQGIPYVWLAL